MERVGPGGCPWPCAPAPCVCVAGLLGRKGLRIVRCQAIVEAVATGFVGRVHVGCMQKKSGLIGGAEAPLGRERRRRSGFRREAWGCDHFSVTGLLGSQEVDGAQRESSSRGDAFQSCRWMEPEGVELDGLQGHAEMGNSLRADEGEGAQHPRR